MYNIFKKTKFLSLLIIFVTTFAFTACNTDSGSNTGTMEVSLTDAPAAYDQVNIQVLDVLVNKNENADEPEGTDGEEDGNGWVSIMDDSITVNLLDYQNGETLPLGSALLETGRYNQVRLMLGDNNSVVISGETIPLTTPSAQQSGYKLLVNAEVEENQVYNLVIDFDASQSITVTGNQGFILKPVLRTVNLQEQPSISGTVLPVEAEPWVYAIMDDDTVGTMPNDDGSFRLIGLTEGSYDVLFEPTNELYADSLVQDIELETSEQFEFEEDIQLQESGS